MSIQIDDGGPAFPFAATDPSNVPMQAQGMTLRDYFAAKAMQGLLAMDSHPSSCGFRGEHQYAGLAYEIADAMLNVRATGETP